MGLLKCLDCGHENVHADDGACDVCDWDLCVREVING